MKLEASRNWNYPKKYAGVLKCPCPLPQAPFLHGIGVYYDQPCLGTAEVLRMMSTVTSSHADTELTHEKTCYGCSKPISSNLLQGKAVIQPLLFPHTRLGQSLFTHHFQH